MPMVSLFKNAQIAGKKKPMITPGTRENGVLPGANESMSAGLTLDYSAIQTGGVPIANESDDDVEVDEADDDVFVDPYNDNVRGNGSMVGVKEEGVELRRNMSLRLSKRAYPDYPQYSDPNYYDNVSERTDANNTPAFDMFNTYYADDGYTDVEEVEVPEDWEDEVVVKEAFIKTAISWDSNPIVQKLMDIPQIRSLIEAQAAGLVDKIIITTPGADLQQTQQQIDNDPNKPKTKLQPIDKDPQGHTWITEDPNTHKKSPLDRNIRLDKVTDDWNTLVTILHEITHHKNPEWSEDQVEGEAQRLAKTVQQNLGGNNVTASAKGKSKVVFVPNRIHSISLVEVEVADTYQKQVIGLQNYSSLRPDAGMLFHYASPQHLSFWMGTVKFPIDILFVNANNQILKIYRNCLPNSTDIYSCAQASKVIEVVGSYCAFHNVEPGDRVFAVDDSDIYKSEEFAKYVLEKIRTLKLEQQKDLGMEDWNVKIVMAKNPDLNKFIKVDWDEDDYKIMKADIIVNPDPILIREATKQMPLDKLVRHALLHILAGHKEELPEDQEKTMITDKLFKQARNKFLSQTLLDHSINKSK